MLIKKLDHMILKLEKNVLLLEKLPTTPNHWRGFSQKKIKQID